MRRVGIIWAAIATCWVTCAPLPAWADGWRKTSNDDGILVETREVADQAMPDVRGTMVMKGDFYEIAALIEDVDHTCDWAKRCLGSRVLKRISEAEMIFYSRTTAPWPVQDRDAVLHAVATGLDRGDDVTMKFESITSPLGPPNDGIVRMPVLKGHYRMQRMDDQTTKIEFQVHADIGGWIPEWLKNTLAKSIPFDTLAGIRRHLPKVRAKYADKVAKWQKVRAATLAATAPANQDKPTPADAAQ